MPENLLFETVDSWLIWNLKDSGIPIKVLRADGGAARNDTFLQFQADLLGIPVVRSARAESTSLRAAFLAGLAGGFWKDMEEIQNRWKIGKEFHRGRATKEMGDLRSRWHQALGRSKAWNEPEGTMGRNLSVGDKEGGDTQR